jgi:hypothetical protein
MLVDLKKYAFIGQKISLILTPPSKLSASRHLLEIENESGLKIWRKRMESVSLTPLTKR